MALTCGGGKPAQHHQHAKGRGKIFCTAAQATHCCSRDAPAVWFNAQLGSALSSPSSDTRAHCSSAHRLVPPVLVLADASGRQLSNDVDGQHASRRQRVPSHLSSQLARHQQHEAQPRCSRDTLPALENASALSDRQNGKAKPGRAQQTRAAARARQRSTSTRQAQQCFSRSPSADRTA